jgi:L-serine deaminase
MSQVCTKASWLEHRNHPRLAMHVSNGHNISLDQVIETMYRTGLDMQSRYIEIGLGCDSWMTNPDEEMQ